METTLFSCMDRTTWVHFSPISPLACSVCLVSHCLICAWDWSACSHFSSTRCTCSQACSTPEVWLCLHCCSCALDQTIHSTDRCRRLADGPRRSFLEHFCISWQAGWRCRLRESLLYAWLLILAGASWWDYVCGAI